MNKKGVYVRYGRATAGESSHHIQLGMGTKDKPKTADVLDELKFLERTAKTWFKKNKFADVEPYITNGAHGGLPPSRPANVLLKGRGRKADAGPADDKNRPRKLTAQGIIRMAEEGQFMLEKQDASGNKMWLCPKYDGNEYNEAKFETIFNAIHTGVGATDQDRAFRDLGIKT
eukprot:7101771-Pyramimonas_sp.AAC.1